LMWRGCEMQGMICPSPYPAFPQWERYAQNHALARKLAENKHRLHIANSLTRDLHKLGVIVQNIDIAVPRPRLYLQDAPLAALPLRGITRRRMDAELFACSAWLDACEVVWSEFEDEVAA